MPGPVQTAALAGYRRLRRLKNRIANRLDAPVVVLIYHRVTELSADPQLLAVSPGNFRAQMRFLKAHCRLVRFEEDWSGLREPAVAVTFDDGYADNALEALPILEEVEVPATFFVSSGTLGTRQEFWWDELERLILGEAKRPGEFLLEDPEHGRSWPASDGAGRLALYRDLQRLMGKVEPDRREEWLEQLRAWAGLGPAGRESHRPLATEELRRLAASKWTTIGAHTVTHTPLVGPLGSGTAPGNPGLQGAAGAADSGGRSRSFPTPSAEGSTTIAPPSPSAGRRASSRWPPTSPARPTAGPIPCRSPGSWCATGTGRPSRRKSGASGADERPDAEHLRRVGRGRQGRRPSAPGDQEPRHRRAPAGAVQGRRGGRGPRPRLSPGPGGERHPLAPRHPAGAPLSPAAGPQFHPRPGAGRPGAKGGRAGPRPAAPALAGRRLLPAGDAGEVRPAAGLDPPRLLGLHRRLPRSPGLPEIPAELRRLSRSGLRRGSGTSPAGSGGASSGPGGGWT